MTQHEEIRQRVLALNEKIQERILAIQQLNDELKTVRLLCSHDGEHRYHWDPYGYTDRWVECLICGGEIPGALPQLPPVMERV